jgi:integrase
MEHMTKTELKRLLEEAYKANKQHHLALTVSLWNATRVSELLNIRASDVRDGSVFIKALKGSVSGWQPIRIDADPLFDCSGLITLAINAPTPDTKLFPVCRQRMDQVIRLYGKRAGIHPDKCHMHALRHSLAMLLWDHTGGSIGLLQRHLRHKSASSSLVYLYESDSRKASAAVAEIRL